MGKREKELSLRKAAGWRGSGVALIAGAQPPFNARAR